MNDEEKKAIEILKNKRPSEQMLISGKMCVDIILNLIEKQDKMINEMAETLVGDVVYDYPEWGEYIFPNKSEVIEYFSKKVGE